MKIHLEQLKHQDDAITAILDAFPPTISTSTDSSFHQDISYIYSNPQLHNAGNEKYFIDCKMETGTGKTYVYTRLMYELQQKRGIYKFIIVVPSLAIKEGTKNFINSDYARQHFSRFFPNKHVNLHIINAGDFSAKKGKRKTLPNGLVSYCDSNRNESNQIQCLLINSAMLTSKSFLDDDYDQTLFGNNSCPVDSVKKTCPIVFIDEPHRIGRENGVYQIIREKINPQLIVRFGATFPEISDGIGKNKIKRIDFYRGKPIFDLGAVESFNQGLVKAVDVFFANLDGTNAINKYHVENITSRKLTLKKEQKIFEINIGEQLPPEFEGNLTYEGGTDKKLNNDLALKEGMDLTTDVFSNSYQEILLSQAIDAHFEKEEENFLRNNNRPKIKTIALFFIDSIKSYRNKDGWLKETFEKLLNKKLDKLLKKYNNKTNNREKEFYDFLQATKKSLNNEQQDVHAGYFAEDRGKEDDAIQAEVHDILSNKEKMLSFKNENGQWNTRRFLFSKWTLREGWDNPNIFTICKLRTSGSETSKIQEVGRGLRLPIDELGNRLSGEEFRLNYIIGWDEKDFAEKLISEINQDAKIILNDKILTDEMIKIITDSRHISHNELLEILDKNNIIDRSNNFKENGYEKLLNNYPELLQTQLKHDKITSPSTKNKRTKIKLRSNNWEKIAEFWKLISKRYMIKFERITENDWKELVQTVLNENIFYDNSINITKYSTEKNINETYGNNSLKLTEQNIHANIKTDIG
ncbi:MAG: type III restriction-modification system endonuclease, partial [Planctomycetaceae bacterium]|nr:type III restriction-modification system endonuclease [Planctomycetaceae bacterium]